MANKLLSAFTNREIERQVRELRARGSGRSTSIALGLISQALGRPGVSCSAADHFHGTEQAAQTFNDTVRGLLAKLGLEHYTLSRVGRVTYLKFTFLED